MMECPAESQAALAAPDTDGLQASIRCVNGWREDGGS